MSVKQEKAYSILNLNSNYVQKLKCIVEQEDKIKAQREILQLSEDI
jgi:hypothetical protein